MFERMKLRGGAHVSYITAPLAKTEDEEKRETNCRVFVQGIRYLRHRSSSGTKAIEIQRKKSYVGAGYMAGDYSFSGPFL